MIQKLLFAAVVLMAMFTVSFSQQQDETTASVPELTSFHDVIYPMWHDAWPKKDVAALVALVPDIEQHVKNISKAKLPGILRDKKPRWNNGIQELKTIVKEYKKAVASGDTQKALDAAEKLHSQYEAMVRIVRPVLKQIDQFHQALYPIYHYYMPKYDKPKLRESMTTLQAAMDTLNSAELPDRYKELEKQFNAKRRALEKSVQYVVKVVNEIDDQKTVKDAVEEVHGKYMALEEVFSKK
jgi:ribosomal protein S20